MCSEWKWQTVTNQVSIIADGENLAVKGAWESVSLLWVSEEDDGRDTLVEGRGEQGGGLVDDLGSLTVWKVSYGFGDEK